MITTPIAKKFYHQFVGAPHGCLKQNKNLLARCAMLIYRKEGRQAAHQFILEVQLLMILDEVLPC